MCILSSPFSVPQPETTIMTNECFFFTSWFSFQIAHKPEQDRRNESQNRREVGRGDRIEIFSNDFKSKNVNANALDSMKYFTVHLVGAFDILKWNL